MLAWGACLVRGGEETAQTGVGGSEAEMSLWPPPGRTTHRRFPLDLSFSHPYDDPRGLRNLHSAHTLQSQEFLSLTLFVFLVVFCTLTNQY